MRNEVPPRERREQRARERRQRLEAAHAVAGEERTVYIVHGQRETDTVYSADRAERLSRAGFRVTASTRGGQ